MFDILSLRTEVERGRRWLGFGAAALGLCTTLVVAACSGGGNDGGSGGSSPTSPVAADIVCSGYQAWEISDFVLPYAVGTAHRVTQGNCSRYTHSDLMRYAYDFEMPIGTPVHAARGGVAVYLEEHWPDGDGEWYHSNLVRIDHGDGTYALYAHLTTDGVLVEVGDPVARGQVIGLSGNSGYTLDLPHLHFHVAPCSFYEHCGTVPVTFANTAPNPMGLVTGESYEAFGF